MRPKSMTHAQVLDDQEGDCLLYTLKFDQPAQATVAWAYLSQVPDVARVASEKDSDTVHLYFPLSLSSETIRLDGSINRILDGL